MENKGLTVSETLPIQPILKTSDVQISGMSPIEKMIALSERGIDLDKIEKMIEFQAKWDAMEGKKAFVQAMANFKKNPPTIFKDKFVGYQNNDGSRTGYSHASLGNVTNTINMALADHGLSASWKQSQSDGKIEVTCTITHEKGHSESTSLSAGSDNTGKKNAIQAIGSTITYLERYTLLALTGLATHDQDDDGTSTEEQPEYIGQTEQNIIIDLLAANESDEKKFLDWIGCESIKTMTAKDYRRAKINLEAKLEKKNANNN